MKNIFIQSTVRNSSDFTLVRRIAYRLVQKI